MYKWFISYAYEKGFGNILIVNNEKQLREQTIREIEEYIEQKNNIQSTIILNMQLIGKC